MLYAGSAPLAADIDVADLARRFPDMSGANIRDALLMFIGNLKSAGSRTKRQCNARTGRKRGCNIGAKLIT